MACGHASRYEAVTCVTVVRRVLRRRVGAWACACLPTRASVSGGDGCAASIVEWRVDASFWHQNVCRRRSRCVWRLALGRPGRGRRDVPPGYLELFQDYWRAFHLLSELSRGRAPSRTGSVGFAAATCMQYRTVVQYVADTPEDPWACCTRSSR